MATVNEIQNVLGSNALIAHIDQVPKGHVRIQTNLLYPDGSAIDVFIEQDNTRLAIHQPKLTDFGTTWSWLDNLEIRPDKSPTNRKHFERILEMYHCVLNGAAIEQEVSNLDNLPVAIVQLGQACLRTADLLYSKRFRAANNFNLEVEDVLADLAPQYQTGGEVALRNGNIVKLDFRVHGISHDTAILTLSSGNEQAAHNRANEINARWDDLYEASTWIQEGNQCVTIYDDSKNIYSINDLNRLQRKSPLVPISSPEMLEILLEAA